MPPVIDLHAALVRIPSLSHEETAAADLVEAHARGAGLAVGRDDAATGGANVWASLGDDDHDVLLLASHLDVVPPSADHPYPPFEPTTVDGRIYGRGAVDAKASGAAMLQALIDLRAGGWRPPGRVIVALTACEETGGPYNGMQALRAHLPPVSAAVVGEPTGLRPCLAQKGLLILTLTARGRTAHAARAHLGDNALTRLARDLVRVDGLAFERVDPLLGPVTVTATMASAGTAKNVVPDRATATLDVRSTPVYTHAELAALIGDALESDVAVHSDRLVPCATPADARVARAAAAASAAHGLDATPFGSPTASDWVFLADVPAVKLGPGRSELSHTADEHVTVNQLTRAVGVYRDLITGYFSSR